MIETIESFKPIFILKKVLLMQKLKEQNKKIMKVIFFRISYTFCSHLYCSAVFTWTNLLVVVVELDGSENEALDLVPLVTNAVLEDHYLIVGVVVVVDPGVVPINSRGEKQRMHLRDGFLADQLDPIYVAYNM